MFGESMYSYAGNHHTPHLQNSITFEHADLPCFQQNNIGRYSIYSVTSLMTLQQLKRCLK